MLLDTNVLSELRKSPRQINTGVQRWAASLDLQLAYISAITIEEIELGIIRKAAQDQAQGANLRRWFNDDVLTAFEGRILAYDTAIALKAASLHGDRPRPTNDARLAATALVHGLTLVTRNIKDFAAMGVGLLNPFDN